MTKELIIPTGTTTNTSQYDSIGQVIFEDYRFSDESKVLTTSHINPLSGAQSSAEIVAVVDINGVYALPPLSVEETRIKNIENALLKMGCISIELDKLGI